MEDYKEMMDFLEDIAEKENAKDKVKDSIRKIQDDLG